MASAVPAGLDPMPGDQSQAADLPGLTGGSPQSPAQPSPDVQAQLRNAVESLRSMNRALDSVLEGVKGVAQTFPGQSEGPSKIAEQVMALKKALTGFVMETVKQAPPAQGPRPTPMR